jgi:hypothetical protein
VAFLYGRCPYCWEGDVGMLCGYFVMLCFYYLWCGFSPTRLSPLLNAYASTRVNHTVCTPLGSAGTRYVFGLTAAFYVRPSPPPHPPLPPVGGPPSLDRDTPPRPVLPPTRPDTTPAPDDRTPVFSRWCRHFWVKLRWGGSAPLLGPLICERPKSPIFSLTNPLGKAALTPLACNPESSARPHCCWRLTATPPAGW